MPFCIRSGCVGCFWALQYTRGAHHAHGEYSWYRAAARSSYITLLRVNFCRFSARGLPVVSVFQSGVVSLGRVCVAHQTRAKWSLVNPLSFPCDLPATRRLVRMWQEYKQMLLARAAQGLSQGYDSDQVVETQGAS